MAGPQTMHKAPAVLQAPISVSGCAGKDVSLIVGEANDEHAHLGSIEIEGEPVPRWTRGSTLRAIQGRQPAALMRGAANGR